MAVKDYVVSIGYSLVCLMNYQKFDEFMFVEIITKKTCFQVQLFLGLIPSHKESPNF